MSDPHPPAPAAPPPSAPSAAKPRNPLLAGTPLQAIGLGDIGNGDDATILQQTQVVLESLHSCNKAWPDVVPDFFRNTAICARAPSQLAVCVTVPAALLCPLPCLRHRNQTHIILVFPLLQAPQSTTASPTSARVTAVCGAMGGAGAAARHAGYDGSACMGLPLTGVPLLPRLQAARCSSPD